MIIGRIKEIEMLKATTADDKSHFIAIYGRRRIGKTFLIREVFNNRFTFEHTGLSSGKTKQQLHAFQLSLINCGYNPKKRIKTWLDAFDELKGLIQSSNEKKKIIFIDELSWMDTNKSDMIVALENFYNSFVAARNDVVLIVCSSATSWILKKVIHNKGGLYNRLTEQINLKSFSLGECEEYVKSQGLVLTRDQIIQGYMIMGGVPYYWGLLKKGLSLSQNIDELFFNENSQLKNEFKYLYSSIFKNPEIYVKIIDQLSKTKSGMTREELAREIKTTNNGNFGEKLEELEACEFIKKTNNFKTKKKGSLYKLVDNYTLFYYNFLKDEPNDPHFFSNQINTPKINTWFGLSFENMCFSHINKIKEKLSINRVLTDVCSYRCLKNEEKGVFGSQIDLLIIRKDRVINLCEIKYSQSEFTPNKEFENSMKRKINDLTINTKTKYAIYPTLITNIGLVNNSYSDIIQSLVIGDDLF